MPRKPKKISRSDSNQSNRSSYLNSHFSFSPLNQEQRDAMRLLRKSDICFLVGPAGTAKTYCAVAYAVQQFIDHEVEISISRPAIQQGENIGFLPGDANQKLSPFLEPIFYAVEKLMGRNLDASRAVKSALKIVPLSLIRGRNIDNSTLIIDEAQNLTWGEIKTICTRIGEGGKIIFCGDVEQNDLRGGGSRLEEAAHALSGIEAEGHSIGSHVFSDESIVRHPLVGPVLRRMRGAEARA